MTLEALRMAIVRRNPGPGLIHHSDQGVQYASDEYVDELCRHGFRISMARRGNPYDNATMESFFKTLKYEEVYLFDYETLVDMLDRTYCVKLNCYRRPPHCVINKVTNI